MTTHLSNNPTILRRLAGFMCLFLLIGLMFFPRLGVQAGQDTPTPTIESTITVTPTPEPTATVTPFPQEWLENHELTNGITAGGVVIVLIIIVSTLVIIRRKY